MICEELGVDMNVAEKIMNQNLLKIKKARNMENEKYILCKSEDHFNKLNRKILYMAYVVGYVNEWGHIFVAKNRFNGVTGTYNKEQYEKLIELSKNFFEKGVDKAI